MNETVAQLLRLTIEMSDQTKNMSDQSDEQENVAAPLPRSPSPSALSTASSASPLIRTNSSSSSVYAAATSGDQQQSGCRNQAKPPGGMSRRPAPTSIAAAQLQQQQLSSTVDGIVPPILATSGSGKAQNCNKLAQMSIARAQQQTVLGAQLANQKLALAKQKQAAHDQQQQQKLKSADEKKKKDKKDKNEKTTNDEAKGAGYNYAKLIAYKASR